MEFWGISMVILNMEYIYIYGILVGSGEISMIFFMIKNYGISGWEWDLMGVFSGGTFWEKPLGCLS